MKEKLCRVDHEYVVTNGHKIQRNVLLEYDFCSDFFFSLRVWFFSIDFFCSRTYSVGYWMAFKTPNNKHNMFSSQSIRCSVFTCGYFSVLNHRKIVFVGFDMQDDFGLKYINIVLHTIDTLVLSSNTPNLMHSTTQWWSHRATKTEKLSKENTEKMHHTQ